MPRGPSLCNGAGDGTWLAAGRPARPTVRVAFLSTVGIARRERQRGSTSLPRLPSYPKVEDVRSEFETRLNGALAQHGATISTRGRMSQVRAGRHWICTEGAIWNAEWVASGFIMPVDGVILEAAGGCCFEDESDGPSSNCGG